MTRTNLALILIASVAGAAAGALTTSLLAPAPFAAQAAAPSANDAKLAEVLQSQSRLEQALAELQASQALLAARPERTTIAAEPAASVSAAATEPAALAKPASDAPPALTVETVLAQLDDPNLGYADRTALWENAHKAGLTDALVAAIEKRAERDPNNPELQVDLGNSYLQELNFASEFAKGKWATKADAAFDSALALDPNHWEARFTKAVSLSHWPALFGKQPKAIGEFETLIAQQNAGPKQEKHAQTYWYLGNMYQATGATAKAFETWQKGLDLFPGNAQLQAQVASSKSH
ncbi:MAG TPA: hypothetical protein VM509_11545 [Planctomycetota bacterium]|nr:hypothetical protein [Planctomycetota bacterium]